MTGEQLGNLLAAEGIIPGEAIDDPEGYDGHRTLDALHRAATALSSSLDECANCGMTCEQCERCAEYREVSAYRYCPICGRGLWTEKDQTASELWVVESLIYGKWRATATAGITEIKANDAKRLRHGDHGGTLRVRKYIPVTTEENQ